MKAENENQTKREASDHERVVSMIKEVAVEICGDYPRIDECQPLEQLYAIEESFKGINAANTDLHHVIMKL